jgi:hypothetical protein
METGECKAVVTAVLPGRGNDRAATSCGPERRWCLEGVQ